MRKYELAWSRDKVDAERVPDRGGDVLARPDEADASRSRSSTRRASSRTCPARSSPPPARSCSRRRGSVTPSRRAAEGARGRRPAAHARRAEARDRRAGRGPGSRADGEGAGSHPCGLPDHPDHPLQRQAGESRPARRSRSRKPPTAWNSPSRTRPRGPMPSCCSSTARTRSIRNAPRRRRAASGSWGRRCRSPSRGSRSGSDKVAPFAVLPPEEPLPDAVRYGDHAGTFRLVVFHGKMTDANPAENMAKGDAKDSATLALSRTRGGTRPPGVKPQSLKALQADLRGRLGTDGARGYVVKGGATETFETRSVYFVASPESARGRYQPALRREEVRVGSGELARFAVVCLLALAGFSGPGGRSPSRAARRATWRFRRGPSSRSTASNATARRRAAGTDSGARTTAGSWRRGPIASRSWRRARRRLADHPVPGRRLDAARRPAAPHGRGDRARSRRGFARPRRATPGTSMTGPRSRRCWRTFNSTRTKRPTCGTSPSAISSATTNRCPTSRRWSSISSALSCGAASSRPPVSRRPRRWTGPRRCSAST